MMGIKGDRKTGRQVTRAVHAVGGRGAEGEDVHLKIVVDVIKDTASTDRRRQPGRKPAVGAICQKRGCLSLAASLVCPIWMSHDPQTRWH